MTTNNDDAHKTAEMVVSKMENTTQTNSDDTLNLAPFYPKNKLKNWWDNVDFIDEFFNELTEYQIPYREDTPFENGHLYTYVSSTLLNGVINYVEPIKAYLLDRYREDEELEEIEKTVNQFNNCEVDFFHTKLDMFKDDLILLAYEDESDYYWYFWFDCDVSDCQIGRFKTDKPREEIFEIFEQHVIDLQQKYCDDYHTERFGKITELNVKNLKGWISF